MDLPGCRCSLGSGATSEEAKWSSLSDIVNFFFFKTFKERYLGVPKTETWHSERVFHSRASSSISINSSTSTYLQRQFLTIPKGFNPPVLELPHLSCSIRGLIATSGL